MSESLASEIAQLKTKLKEANRVARLLGLSVRNDSSVYLVDLGTREGAAVMRRRLIALYEQLAEKFTDIAEQETPGKYRVDLSYDSEHETFRAHKLTGEQDVHWDLISYSFNLLSKFNGVADE